MEEEKADELYRLFKKTDASARFKQGLGFGSEEPWSAPRSVSQPSSTAPTGLSSMFVKAGESKAPTASAPPKAADPDPGQARAAAARVAAKLAQLKAATAKPPRMHDSPKRTDPDRSSSDRHRSRSGERHTVRDRSHSHDRNRDRSKDRGRDRDPSRDRHRDRSRSKDRHRSGSRDRDHRQRSRSRHRERSRGRHRSRSRSRDRQGHRNRDRSRERGAGSRRRSSSRDRHRRRDRSRSRDRYDPDPRHDRHERFGDRRRDEGVSDKSRGGDGGRAWPGRSAGSGLGSGAVVKVDWASVIRGYQDMTPVEQMKARTEYQLRQAHEASERRHRQEVREEAEQAEQEGRAPEAARPWTRYTFDSSAPLDTGSKVGTARTAGDYDPSVPVPGLYDTGDAAERARLMGVDEEGAKLNTVSFKVDAKTAATRERDDTHAAAIFGTQPSAPHSQRRPESKPSHELGHDHGQGTDLGAEDRAFSGAGAGATQRGGNRRARDAADLDQGTLESLLLGGSRWQDVMGAEDGPVLVLPDDIPDTPPRDDDADNDTTHTHAGGHHAPQQPGMQAVATTSMHGQGAGRPGAVGVVDGTVLAQQSTLSWRDRALQARQLKAAQEQEAKETLQPEVAQPPAQAAPLTLQFSWRDKARARHQQQTL